MVTPPLSLPKPSCPHTTPFLEATIPTDGRAQGKQNPGQHSTSRTQGSTVLAEPRATQCTSFHKSQAFTFKISPPPQQFCSAVGNTPKGNYVHQLLYNYLTNIYKLLSLLLYSTQKCPNLGILPYRSTPTSTVATGHPNWLCKGITFQLPQKQQLHRPINKASP